MTIRESACFRFRFRATRQRPTQEFSCQHGPLPQPAGTADCERVPAATQLPHLQCDQLDDDQAIKMDPCEAAAAAAAKAAASDSSGVVAAPAAAPTKLS